MISALTNMGMIGPTKRRNFKSHLTIQRKDTFFNSVFPGANPIFQIKDRTGITRVSSTGSSLVFHDSSGNEGLRITGGTGATAGCVLTANSGFSTEPFLSGYGYHIADNSNVPVVSLGNNFGIALADTYYLQFSSTTNARNGTKDLFLKRDSAATLQMGQTSATPIAQTLKGADGSGSNIAGGSISICGGKSTGTGNGGDVIFKVNIPGSSGSSLNTPASIMTISGSTGGATITSAAATTIPLTITGAASQSANLINVTANGGSAGGLLAFTAAGRLNIGGTTIDSLGRHLNVVSTTPGIGLYESDVTTDEKGWDMAAAASTFSFRCFNDALNAASNIFTVTRSGYIPNHMKIFPALEVSSYYYTTYTNNGNSGAAKTIDWSASPVQRITLDASCTLTFTAPNGISDVLLHITQNGTGGYSVTWPASVKWAGGTAPTITTTAGAVSVVRLFYDGKTYWGDYTLDVR